MLLGAAAAGAADPKTWETGELIKIERIGGSFDYSVFADRCGYVGRTSKRLDLVEDSTVKFSVLGRTIYFIDQTGRVQKTRFRRQWRAPPPLVLPPNPT